MSDDGTFPGSVTRHGTNSGWTKHVKAGERPCDPCYAAKSEYDKRRRSAPDRVIKSRLHAKAQMKAYQRLAHQFPSLYREYYLVAKAAVYDEAGVGW